MNSHDTASGILGHKCRLGLIALVGSLIWLTPLLLTAQSATPVTLDGNIHPDSDDTLAFTPDGNTVFFDRSEGPHKTIMVSHRLHGHWAKAEVASFSGQWFDQDPLVAPDGSYLLFNSDRPVRPGSKPLTQNYFVGGTAPGSNIWRVNRIGASWGKPVWLGPTINTDAFIDFASLAADGTLYFMRWNSTEKAMHIWRSAFRDGRYLAAELVTVGDPTVSVHDPAVAPDQSFMVLDYGKVKGGLGRLCIAFRDGNHWGKPIDLGDTLNKDLPWGAHLAPDGQTVYVTGQSGISQISFDSKFMAQLRQSDVGQKAE
ncbi:WD40 domain protein beta Propeller [Acidisarcina polymorpha]|uniref:WD40 domain protein beta Propeller n=1 Tax=Acidisarcina polymorpha TaxID=2211140 RepID=A0A2Z5FZI8_9BACT|nr:PD40 domain-containing protein [Acidisarcina polymorpha]AXC12179.1 WD40 domain protein beta Propeller [Acidisarcina polymorpha]